MGLAKLVCRQVIKMRIILALTFVVAALMAPTFAEEDPDWPALMELVDVSPEGELMQKLDEMQRLSPTHMHYHINRIAKHAVLMQMDGKSAKAYSHNFDASKAAIKAALSALTSQLNTGHTHDKNALATGKGQAKCQTFKNKACPTKREELEADAAKANAKKQMQAVGKGKVCSGLGSTWGDMDVDKSTPKYGEELRNKWDKKRAEYEKAKKKYDDATAKHNAAVKKHNAAMAEFKTALDIEAKNGHDACKNSHTEYAVLKKEVASNVAARKQVFIATLVVTCYVDNLTDNAAAKTCADKKRGASTSAWNITPGTLPACATVSELTNLFGPANWLPTSSKCNKAWHMSSGKLLFDLED